MTYDALSLTIESRIDHQGDCWLWTGGLSGNNSNAPQIRFQKKKYNVKRYLYERQHGPLNGQQLRNACGDKLCVNPAHQEIVVRLSKAEYSRQARARKNAANPKPPKPAPEPKKLAPPKPTLLDKIVARISYKDDHWILNQKGPQMRHEGKCYRPVLVFWALHVGPLDEKDKLFRTCGVDGCVNPAHHQIEKNEQAYQRVPHKRANAIDKVHKLARKCGFELVRARPGVWTVEHKNAS